MSLLLFCIHIPLSLSTILSMCWFLYILSVYIYIIHFLYILEKENCFSIALILFAIAQVDGWMNVCLYIIGICEKRNEYLWTKRVQGHSKTSFFSQAISLKIQNTIASIRIKELNFKIYWALFLFLREHQVGASFLINLFYLILILYI